MQAAEDLGLVPGRISTICPGIRRILAPNPSAFTGPGTNTYLVGTRGVAVIDPGPEDAAHLAAILGALAPQQHVSHILITHAHRDHSPLARALSAQTGAPVLAYGDALAGRSEIMHRLAAVSDLGGGEGSDDGFRPDIALPDGALVQGDGWSLRALWTPGHFGNHLCFQTGTTIFTGDLVMGWSSSLVSPPDGDLSDFMASCARLLSCEATLFLPGHGPEVSDPPARLRWLIGHRQQREAALLAALANGPGTPAQLAARVYTDIDPGLLPAATRNVLAHLIDLTGKKLAAPIGPLQADAAFRLT